MTGAFSNHFKRLTKLLCLAALLLLASCASGPSANSNHSWRSYQTGKASWYGGKFQGRKTASGKRYNQWAMTAAHKKLPFGTNVRVTNLNNGHSCVVRINDRGPFVWGRVIDLSAAAAKRIGVYNAGVTPVRIDVPR